MSNNSEYNDLNKCLSEYQYWNRESAKSWCKNPDPIENKECQLYDKKAKETLDYVKKTYNIKSVKELKHRVQELERWQKLEQQPTHHIAEPQPHREVNFEDRYKSPPELDQKQPEQQPTHHIAEPRPRRQFDFEDRYK